MKLATYVQLWQSLLAAFTSSPDNRCLYSHVMFISKINFSVAGFRRSKNKPKNKIICPSLWITISLLNYPNGKRSCVAL